MKLFQPILALLIGVSWTVGQRLEECYPKKIEAEEVAPSDQENSTLTLETYNNYFDLCVTRGGVSTVNERTLLRTTSETCTEFPIDPGYDCTAEATQYATRYGFDVDVGQCIKFEYKGCGGNANRFYRMEECSYICEDPCTQPRDEGVSTIINTGKSGRDVEIDCNGTSGTYYYYSQQRQTCFSFDYLGCGGNKNRFESNDDCLYVCRSEQPPPPNNDTNSLVVNPNLANLASVVIDDGCEENMDDMNATKYCDKFQQRFSEEADLFKILGNVSSREISGQLVNELESRVTRSAVRSSIPAAASKAIGLIAALKPLKHTTVKIYSNSNCRKIDITIRIWCIRGLTNRPNNAQKEMLCKLIKEGIKKHWEVDILNVDGTVNYAVTVTVKETPFFSKKALLKYYTSPPANDRSYNPGWHWFPMVVKYRAYNDPATEDVIYRYTAAHEFGHDVLMAAGGLVYSWGHEGTSTIFGNTVPSTPSIPPTPAILDLMWYYNSGFSSTDYSRIFASQSQINALVNYATFKFVFWWCPGAIGAPCLVNAHCDPPGICSWFRCVHCSLDSQCPSGQYCKGRLNPFVINECVPKKANGGWCTRDAMCTSNICDGGRCTECEYDYQCPSGEYCKYNNLPAVENKCTPKKANGQFCLQDRVCESGHCDGGQCVECALDSHCPSGEWCKNKNLPLIQNFCTSKLGIGGWCSSDNQCASGYCDGGRCGECEEHHHCASDQYCKWKNTPGVVNRCKDKKCTGFCTKNIHCLSGKCRIIGFCKPC